MGAGEGALFSGTLPWVLTGVPAARAGRVAGWFGLSMWGGLSAGPLLAVTASRPGGPHAVWGLVIALPLISVVLLASTPRAPRPRADIRTSVPPGRDATRPGSTRLRDLLPPGTGTAGTVLGLASYGYGTLTALLVLFLGTAGIGGQGLGLAIFSTAFLVTRACGSPLTDRYGGLAVARAVLLVQTAGLALLASAQSGVTALAAVAVAGVGLGLIYPAATKMTLAHAPAPAAGAAVGTMTSFWDLGILAAGAVGGLIASVAGFRIAFWIAAAVALLALLVTVTVRQPRPGNRV